MIANSLPTARPTVSIVLLTRNGLPDFERCVSMISQQTIEAEVEIIHIDSGSTDGTLDASAFAPDSTHIRSDSDFHHP